MNFNISTNNALRILACVGASLLFSACATPKFPQSGTPSPYDGKWTVDLDSQDNPNCNDTHGTFEVRYGYVIGLVEWRHENYELWGEITDSGKLNGFIGQLGVSGAKADVDFTANNASGTWQSKGCGKGTLQANKIPS